METRILAELEKAIEIWSENNCEESDWPQSIWWYDDLQKDMAKAAAAVFDANQKGQKFKDEND